jgi:hypothetical protein
MVTGVRNALHRMTSGDYRTAASPARLLAVAGVVTRLCRSHIQVVPGRRYKKTPLLAERAWLSSRGLVEGIPPGSRWAPPRAAEGSVYRRPHRVSTDCALPSWGSPSSAGSWLQVGDRESTRAFQDAWVGRAAPDFELELLNRHKLRLSGHVGRELIVLNFFASGVAPAAPRCPS